PARPEVDLARTSEHAVSQFAGAKAGKADQLRLLLARCRPVLLGDEDGRNIGTGTILPGRR
ncbi:hypothetical protein, partial [Agrobacterium tumefaciens]|uniref:hypothetical protein n=1 Tax=Agrobacterium tumefaciens TaxID=358 RepID=UPI001B8A0117